MEHGPRILALETTGLSGSVAALVGDRVLASLPLADGQRSARALAPAIAELCRQVGWRPIEVALIAATVGPGSFTGLRVGVTTAKTLAYAAGAAVVGVDALQVVAAQMPPEISEVWATFDAQRNELFVARLVRTNPSDPLSVQFAAAGRIVDAAAWIAARQAGEVVTGPGIAPWRDKLPPGVAAVEPDLWHPQAAFVGRVGWRQRQSGAEQDLWALAPRYIRVSAAEEKAQEKLAK